MAKESETCASNSRKTSSICSVPICHSAHWHEPWRRRALSSEGAVGLTDSPGAKDPRKAIPITVSADTAPDLAWDRSEAVPTISQVLMAIRDIPINRYSFETTALFKANFDEWARQMR
ncbi:MAG: hypothetical protein ABI593_04630 [Betaproteobacteria bacterium]